MMKEFNVLMLMNDSSLCKPSLSSIQLSDNDDEVLVYEACTH